MATFAQRRRARLEARRPRPFYEDPENEERRRDCARQMKVFDRLSPAARRRIADRTHDTDAVELVRDVEVRGASDQVRHLLRQRGLLPCDVPLDELVSMEIEGRRG